MPQKHFINITGIKSADIDRERHRVTVVVSDESIDRDGEIIKADAWDLTNYQKNPVLLDSHQYRGIDRILGRAVDWQVKDGKLIMTFEYAVNKGNPLTNYAWALIESGLGAFSVGFYPHDWIDDTEKAERIYTKVELLEVSQVTVPANPNAVLATDADKSLVEALTKAFEALTEAKGVIGYSKAPWLPDATKWDANRARRDALKYALKYAGGTDNFDPKKYKQFFLWYDESKPENVTSYKLPYRYLNDGKPANVWRGVVAAMAAVLGAREGVNIPEKDRRGVYNVLARLYREHGNEPPEFKQYQNDLDIMQALGYNKIDDILDLYAPSSSVNEAQEPEQGKSPDAVLVELLQEVRNELQKALKQEE